MQSARVIGALTTERGVRAAREPRPARFVIDGNTLPDEEANRFINSLVSLEGEVMAIVTAGIDLANNVFPAHGNMKQQSLLGDRPAA